MLIFVRGTLDHYGMGIDITNSGDFLSILIEIERNYL